MGNLFPDAVSRSVLTPFFSFDGSLLLLLFSAERQIDFPFAFVRGIFTLPNLFWKGEGRSWPISPPNPRLKATKITGGEEVWKERKIFRRKTPGFPPFPSFSSQNVLLSCRLFLVFSLCLFLLRSGDNKRGGDFKLSFISLRSWCVGG